MKKSSWVLPAFGVGTAVVTLLAAYLILRFAPSPFEIATVAVAVLLAALAALGYVATKREQAAAFVAIALVLPYLLIGTVAYAGLGRASSEIGSIFEEGDQSVPEEEFFQDEGPIEEEGGAYGSDPELDALQDACLAGDEQACDDLYWHAPGGSEYESTAEENGGGP